MAFLAAIIPYLSAAGAAVGVAGSGMQNEAAIKQGKQAAEFKRDQARAVQAEAAQRMLAERDTKERITSRAVAIAAAGGGSVSDPTTQKIIGDLEGEGTYREMLAMYQGERQAKLLVKEGAALQQEGRDRATAYGAQGISSALQGVSSLYSKYNDNRINKPPASPLSQAKGTN